jgi:hypothetical protein
MGLSGLIGELVRAFGIPTRCTACGARLGRRPGGMPDCHGKQRHAEGRLAELERKIGLQALDLHRPIATGPALTHRFPYECTPARQQPGASMLWFRLAGRGVFVGTGNRPTIRGRK